MKYLIFIFSVFIFWGCGSVKNSVNHQKGTERADIADVVLNEEQTRKFNYYFFEGNRYKALNESNKSFMYFAEALKIDSTCSACAYELSRLLLANENLEEAEELMDRAVKFSPDNKFYINLYSRILQANKKGAKAVDISESLLNLESSTVEDLYFVAQVKIQNGLYDEAVQVLDLIEKQIGVNENLVFEKVQLYLENDQLKDAEEELKSLLEKYPGNSDFKIILGDFYLENGDLKKAYDQYQSVYSQESDNGKVLFSLANYFLEEGDTLKFKDYLMRGFKSENVVFDNKFRRFVPFVSGKDITDNPLNKTDLRDIYNLLIEKHPYQSEVYASYSEFLKSEGQDSAAVSVLEKSLELDASQPEIWQEYLFLISSMNDNPLLKEKANEAVTFFPDVPLFRLFQGVSLFQTGDTVTAISSLHEGLKNVGDNAGLKQRFYAYLGDFYYTLDSLSQSFNNYQKALEIDENDVMVLNNYSYYLSIEKKELDKAERMSARTIELQPGNPTFLDTYAWILFQKGQYAEAKFIIERAVDNMDEPSGVIIEHYGDILYKNGDVQGAIEQWEKALELKDHSKVLEQKIERKEYIDED